MKKKEEQETLTYKKHNWSLILIPISPKAY